MYLITVNKAGKLKHYVSSKAKMHYEIVTEYSINLKKELIIEKGFILRNCKIFASYDIRKNENKKTT